jgi:hypothetical protein
MAPKKNLSLIFLLAAAAGFLIFLGMESLLSGFIEAGEFSQAGYFGTFIQTRIEAFGTKEALDLLPQLKFRWLLLCLFAFWLMHDFSAEVAYDENRLRWRVRLFFVIQLLLIPELLAELNIRWRWAAFFEPPLLPGFFVREMPPLMFMQFCGLFLFGLSAWMVLTKWKNATLLPAVFALLIWLFWTFLLSIYQSGGVTDHAYASMHSAMFFMAAFLFIWWKFPQLAGSGHRIFQAGIWGCYFFAGAEKLFLSGFSWLDPEVFSRLCLHHPGKFCHWFAAHPMLAGTAFLSVLAFQLLSPLQWKFPRWGYVTAFVGIAFHLGTWLVLDVGGWQSPWIPMLLFLLPVKTTQGEEIKKQPA